MELFLTKTGHEFCDFTLMLDGESIQTHMSIMASRCAYFECMFRSMMPENKTTEVGGKIHDYMLFIEATLNDIKNYMTHWQDSVLYHRYIVDEL